MTHATAAVLAEALRLDEQARAELAAELLASLDGPADTDAERASAMATAAAVMIRSTEPAVPCTPEPAC